MTNHLNYFKYLLTYVIIFSSLELYTNKFYHKIWNKKTNMEKIKIIFLLIAHSIACFIIFGTLPYILIYYKTINWKLILIYLFIIIAVPIHWTTNNSQCFITVEQNKLLEISEDYTYRNIGNILTNSYPKINKNLSAYEYILIIAIISCVVILFKKREHAS
mgnify:CR=1 FL=1